MQFHRGRLIDHVHLRVAEVQRSAKFYKAVLEALNLGEGFVAGSGFFYADELFVDRAEGPLSKVHLAFQASDRDAVLRFHRAALAAGGTDNGAPGERGYHPGYYAAFALDPDGNNIEAVYHGPVDKSADSVVITPVSDRAA
ncbi:VOC family protein [soil metagenome]